MTLFEYDEGDLFGHLIVLFSFSFSLKTNHHAAFSPLVTALFMAFLMLYLPTFRQFKDIVI